MAKPNSCRLTRRQLLAGMVTLGVAGTWPVLAGIASKTSCLNAAPPNTPIPAEYFGMHIHRTIVPQPWLPDGERLTPWPEVKFGSWRLWDAYVAWPNLEPQKGQWQFETLDKYVAMASLAKVDILLPLGLSPPWASSRPSEPSSYKPGNAAEPASLEDWRNYVRTVATRYKDRIRVYEIWNEINLKGFYSGDLDVMVTLARIAHEEIKAADPDALVVSPSITGGGRNPVWLDRYFSKGGGRYADVIGYHFYVPKREPESILPVVRDVQAIMRKHGLEKKALWNTEAGWWIENLNPTERLGAAGSDWLRLDQEIAAAFVSRALILNWATGVSRFYWYAWDNRDMGLFDIGERKQKLAALAYSRTVDWILGAKFHQCECKQTVWMCDFDNRDGKRGRIVWRESGKASSWRVPPEWNASEYETLAGVRTPVGETLQLGQQPVLLK